MSFSMLLTFFKRLARHIGSFYTLWAVFFHVGYALGYLPNTFVIAVFVLLISQFFFFVRPGQLKKYGRSWKLVVVEFAMHYLPVLVFLVFGHVSFSGLGVWVLCITLAIYRLVHGAKKIIRIYSDPYKRIRDIWHS